MSTEMAPGSNALSFIFSPRVAKRSLAIAGIVGCLLSLTNQGDVLLQEGISARVGIKILMNFIIPFSVSSVSALLNRNSSQGRDFTVYGFLSPQRWGALEGGKISYAFPPSLRPPRMQILSKVLCAVTARAPPPQARSQDAGGGLWPRGRAGRGRRSGHGGRGWPARGFRLTSATPPGTVPALG